MFPPPLLLRRVLLVTAGLLAVWALAISLTGGGVVEVGGLRLSSRGAGRPALAALLLVALVALAATPDARRRGLTRAETLANRGAPWAAVLLALVLAASSTGFNQHVAGDADSSGYVSQSRLWPSGRLAVPAPVYSDDTWPQRGWLVSPLGYAPSVTPDTLGPTYAPGLPWLMALGAAVLGEAGHFIWTPLAAGLVVWLTFVLGRRLAPPLVALGAAVLVAGSAPVLFNAMQTMSDLVCTALWTGAILAATSSRPRPLPAGALAALALAVRPNLLVVAGLVWLVSLVTCDDTWAGRARRGLVMALPLIGVAAIVALINQRLWGSPFASGYGATGDLFQAANVGGNLARVWRWTRETAGWWTLAGVPAAMAWVGVRATRATAATGTALVVGLATSYLPYALFEEWWYLRFYLPAWPVLAAAFAAAAWAAGTRVAPRLAPALVLVLSAVIAREGLRIADHAGVFALWTAAQRYPAAAAWIRGEAPPRALVLAVQHSGALADAAGRTVGRWDYIAPDGLDATVERLAAEGRTVWLVVDSFEEGPFRSRFASARRGALDWAPLAALRAPGERVHIYDLTTPTRTTAPAIVPVVRGGPWPWTRRLPPAK